MVFSSQHPFPHSTEAEQMNAHKIATTMTEVFTDATRELGRVTAWGGGQRGLPEEAAPKTKPGGGVNKEKRRRLCAGPAEVLEVRRQRAPV